ncbi:MAG: winged helix-turn-helix domain-containing protein [Bacteroidetes bacterium]|nr:MAG: winged helix-turn-helix domain-containing protein [Bacteroidota bacterium]
MTSNKESISIQQARKLVLLSQRVPPVKPSGNAVEATLLAIEHLGYIQIDTISVIQRAHHHTLWNRNPRYKTTHLDQLIADRQVFEYWSHAAAFLPMCDYRYSLYRKNAIASGTEKHWYAKDKKLMDYVIKRIADEGPLMAKDFVHNGDKLREWQSKPTKQALENLFMQGELMISGRNKFHKVYDLTERVLPQGIDTSVPSKKEYIRFLIRRYLKANGIGQAAEITYLLKNIKPLVVSTMKEMAENGELIHLQVNEINYFALPDSLELLDKPLSRSKLKILSPFDNLLIQRKRMQALFDFDYLIECYVPEAKRKYGYFSLPILWNGKLVARMDCKADRKTSILHLRHLALEPGLRRTEAFAGALKKELVPFMQFNGCEKIQLHTTSPTGFKSELEEHLGI